MNGYKLSDFMERLKRTQELPIQNLEDQAAPVEESPLKMPEMGVQFEQPIGSERMRLTDTDLSSPMKPEAEKGMSSDVAKAGIQAVGGTLQALAQSAFLQEEGRKKAESEAMTTKAVSRAKSSAQTGAQQFGGLANLMDVYRGVYGGRRR